MVYPVLHMMTVTSCTEQASSQHSLMALTVERRKSRACGQQALMISYHRMNPIKNVTIECIEGNWVRGVPLRCPYLYTIKRNKSVSVIFLLTNVLYEGEGML